MVLAGSHPMNAQPWSGSVSSSTQIDSRLPGDSSSSDDGLNKISGGFFCFRASGLGSALLPILNTRVPAGNGSPSLPGRGLVMLNQSVLAHLKSCSFWIASAESGSPML